MAIKTRTIYPKPALPTLGSAGFQFTDPIFASRMVRITDANTRPGEPNKSYTTPSSSGQRGWNSNSTKFYVCGGGAGGFYAYTFNPATMTATYQTILNFIGDCVFSGENPNYIYGNSSTHLDHHTVTRADLSTDPPTYTVVVDLDDVIAGLVGDTYAGTSGVGGGDKLVILGGGTQDTHTHVVWYPLNNPAGVLVRNVLTAWGATFGFHLHNAQVDQSGRYVVLTPANNENPPNPLAVWDTTLDTLTWITVSGGGHSSTGWGTLLNAQPLGAYDAAQWIYRTLATPNTGLRELITPLLTPMEQYLGEHDTWLNAQGGALVPFVAGTYRYYDGPNNVEPFKNLTPLRAWDDEIISVRTDGLASEVWRHCHTRTQVWPELGTYPFEFWYTPRPNVSPDGKWILFTSNWEKTLGTEAGSGIKRQDVFLVERTLDDVVLQRAHRRARRLR